MQWVPGALSREVKYSELKADRSLLPSGEEMEIYLHGHILFTVWCLIKPTINFVYVLCFTGTPSGSVTCLI
jgi:hypothetical protein